MVQISKGAMIFVALILFLGAYFALPNILCSKAEDGGDACLVDGYGLNSPITLGLDLQGGAYLVIEAEVSNVADDTLKTLQTQISRFYRSDRIRTSRPVIENGVLTYRISRAEDMGNAARIARTNAGLATVEEDAASRTLRLSLSEEAVAQRIDEIVTQTVEIIRKRIDGFGLTEPSLQRQGDKRIVLQLPGARDIDQLKSGLLKTAELEFRLVSDLRPDQSIDVETVPYAPGASDGFETQLNLNIFPDITGTNLQDARQSFDTQSGLPLVTFRLDGSGAFSFARITTDNVDRRFAIVLDGEIISAPVIRSPITAGSGQISGNFTVASANELAVLLRSGALPAKINFLDERTVGPSLGADSIRAGFLACLLGLLFVLIFMGVYYGTFGLFANIALLSNLIVLVGALTVLPATLTLPGIAGIVLTVGMAVDANVLIFERIKEIFQAKAKSTADAIKDGYSAALSTIIDANLTTFIAALLLFLFGSGPIRGFSVTLSIGILTSMFSALLLTRFLIGLWWSPKRETLPIV